MKHEIKNRWTGEVLFTYEAPEGMELGMIARHAVETAIAQGADLRDANLRGADLRGANLRGADLRGAKNAPLIITGLRWVVYISGTGNMRIGRQNHSIKHWDNFSDELINRMDDCALEFWKQHKEMLMGICNSYKHKNEKST